MAEIMMNTAAIEQGASVSTKTSSGPSIDVPFSDSVGAIANDALEESRKGSDYYDRKTGVGSWSVKVSSTQQLVGLSFRTMFPLIQETTGASAPEGSDPSLNFERLRAQLLRPEFREYVWSNESHRAKVQGLIRQDPREAPNSAVVDYWKENRFSPQQFGEIVRALAAGSCTDEVAIAVGEVYGLGQSGEIEEVRAILSSMKDSSQVESQKQFISVFEETLGVDFQSWSEMVGLAGGNKVSTSLQVDSRIEKFYDLLFRQEPSVREARQLLSHIPERNRDEFIKAYQEESEKTPLEDVLHHYKTANNADVHTSAAIALSDSINRTDATWGTRWARSVDDDKMALIVNTSTDDDLKKIANAYPGGADKLCSDFDAHLPGHYERLRIHKVLEQDYDKVKFEVLAASKPANYCEYNNQSRVLEAVYGKNGKAAADLASLNSNNIASFKREYLESENKVDVAKMLEIAQYYFGPNYRADALSAHLAQRCGYTAEADRLSIALTGFNPGRTMQIISQSAGRESVCREYVQGMPSTTWASGHFEDVYRPDAERLAAQVAYLKNNPENLRQFLSQYSEDLRKIMLWRSSSIERQGKKINEMDLASAEAMASLLAPDLDSNIHKDVAEIIVKGRQATISGEKEAIEAAWKTIFNKEFSDWARENKVNVLGLFADG